ncbi:spore cortex-lytic enzyme [Rossellomorea vietnamensis]|uniref:Spore cortex-lytic enzyme n=2 Tax=Rossellomorea vietnamensis TaxID=218284 RepID=A0A5D4KK42_9BACI|nr:spore cortex-lytic enzyme [Rossellomorea vietnamensis]TYR76653.1 spore cortex-lytic enzyme [Rossellomorea vietnamensis]
MKKRIKLLTVFLLMVLILTTLSFKGEIDHAEAFSNQVIQKGATGEDVIELQSRLQYVGYYNGKIDGVFGWGTYWALRNFQYEFGLPIDGLAGQETKDKLVKASKYNKDFVKKQINQGKDFSHYGGTDLSSQSKGGGQGGGGTPAKQGTPPQQAEQPKQPTAVNMPNGFSQNDIQLMANAVYGEARGEPYEGQVAVAAVILNRIDSPSFPNTVSGVIFEPGAFTAVADGQIWLTPNEKAKEAVMDAIQGWDPSENAQYYFNPVTATSKWIWTRPQIKKIGKHIFCN